jgi:8-oxo-dGTP diphosphatase
MTNDGREFSLGDALPSVPKHQKDWPVYRYPRVGVTVDVVVFYNDSVLLIERKGEPFAGYWALPGGFLNIDEEVAHAAARELKEETGIDLSPKQLTQVGLYDKVDRNPKYRVINFAYYVELDYLQSGRVKAGDDAADAKFHTLSSALTDRLAFDHKDILLDAITLRTAKRNRAMLPSSAFDFQSFPLPPH